MATRGDARLEGNLRFNCSTNNIERGLLMATKRTTSSSSTAKTLIAMAGKSGKTSSTLTRRAQSLTSQFVKATHSGDAKLMASMVTGDFTWTDETGTQMMMASCVESIEAMVSRPPDELSRLSVDSFKLGNVQARSFGESVVETLRYTDTVSILDKGSKRPRKEKRDMLVTAVWVTQGKEQRLAALHMSSVQKN